MDIMGPVTNSVLVNDPPNCIRSTEKQVRVHHSVSTTSSPVLYMYKLCMCSGINIPYIFFVICCKA